MRQISRCRPRSGRCIPWNTAFTLIEIVVAMAVLTMLLLLLSYLIGDISKMWQRGKARVDNYTKARVSLDLIERDLKAAIIARGLPGFQNSSGTPALSFYCAQQGPVGGSSGPSGTPQTSVRPLSLVSYRIVDNPASTFNRGLQRGAQGVSYSQNAPFQQAGAPFPAPVLPLMDGYYQVIGPGVMRMDFRFLSRDGSKLSRQFTWNASSPALNSCTVTICLLVIDEGSLRQLDAQSGGYIQFLGQFDAAVAGVNDGEYPFRKWQAAVESATTFAGIPATLRQNVYVYERTITLSLR
ncbi:MAG: PilW family protein [Candidatus Methylacidiphilales bacterium]|nr:prepilin-type N-terminal cleavage/methylation domain-containing protein [Candidatus Methylacidiphilales bacterium]